MKQVSGILLLLICAIGIFAWKEYDKQSRIAYLNNRISAKEVNDQQQKAHQKALAKKEAENKNKYKVRVVHDSKPETNTYPIILDASASHDPDAGDKLTYEWIQTSGVPVSLKPDMNTAIVSFEGTPGEYSFELVITDNYGAKTRKVKSVKIHPEPNETPIVKIKVRQGKRDRKSVV